MMYLTFLCVIMVIMFTVVPVLNERPCNYEIDFRDEGLIIETAEIGKQSIQTLTFTRLDVPSRRKRDLVPAATFMNSSPYFVIVSNEVFIMTCPPVGQTHQLDITLKENRECVYSFSVTVNPSKPEISAPEATTVKVSSADGDVDVLEITIKNEGRCTNFECSATFIDVDVNVWIDKVSGISTIRISPDDIQFGIVYQLRLSCDTPSLENENTEDTVVEKEITEENGEEISEEITEPNVAVVQVTFIDGSSMTSGKYKSAFAQTTHAVNSTAFPTATFIDYSSVASGNYQSVFSRRTQAVNSTASLASKAYLSVCLVMPMTVTLQWEKFLN